MIDIDSLTIGEAKRLASLFGGATVAPAASPFAPLVGKVALVRSRGSGVWAGVVESAHEGAAGHTLTLSTARRLWSWLASLFGGATVAPSSPPAENIGDVVLLRTFAAGVWIGRKVWERESGAVVKLTEARRLWKFKGAGDCSELSLVGPRDGGQIGPVVTTTVQGVIEEYVATSACIEAVAKVAPWSR